MPELHFASAELVMRAEKAQEFHLSPNPLKRNARSQSLHSSIGDSEMKSEDYAAP
jgi:hypothetical protein